MSCRSLLVHLFLFVGHCVVCSSSIYGIWLPLWYHQPFHFANWIPLICHQRMWDKGNNRNSHLCLNSGPLPPIWRKWSTCSHSVWQTRWLQCCHFRFLTNWQCISICFYWGFPFLLRSVRLSVWDTVNEYLDSPLANDKEDASDLRAAISRANGKRSTPKPYNRPDNQYGSVNRGSGSAKFNPRSFFRGFSGAGFNSETSSVQTIGRCFYCNQQGHFARICPHKGIPTATATAPKAQNGGKTQWKFS